MPRRLFCKSVMIARWTTARAVSGGADLRSRNVSPTFSPVKEMTGRVASWEEIVRGFVVRVVWEVDDLGGVKIEFLNLVDEKKIEDEKNERDDEEAEAIFVRK